MILAIIGQSGISPFTPGVIAMFGILGHIFFKGCLAFGRGHAWTKICDHAVHDQDQNPGSDHQRLPQV